MKVVVIGGTGLIGSKVVARLRGHDDEAVPASPGTGVDALTGEGLPEALDGASVVVDASNSPSFEDGAVLDFFRTSTANLLAAELDAGVGHHVALSVVGTERAQEIGYFRAKQAQEELIRASAVPCSIVHATQFFEFVAAIAASATEGGAVLLPRLRVQPMHSDDVAAAVFRTAVGTPVNGVVDVAGPEVFPLDELIREQLGAEDDREDVVTDSHARYFGAELRETTEDAFLPGPHAHIAGNRWTDWITSQRARPLTG